MLEKCHSAKERWGGVHDIIDRWLNERRELIVSLFALNGSSEFANPDEPREDRLARFCELLVDYASAGHFEVYEQLIKEAQAFADKGIDEAQKVMRQLDSNTEHILAFNDQFRDASATRAHWGDLDDALASLGSHLEDRFALEDRLIQDLHEAHRGRAMSME